MRLMFKNLTGEDKAFLKELYYSSFSYEQKIQTAIDKFNITRRTVFKWWSKLGCSKEGNKYYGQLPRALQKASERELKPTTRVLLVTSAQNESICNTNLLGSMEAYASYIERVFGLETEIVIIPSRYRNPTTPIEAEEKKVDMWWDNPVKPYLIYGKVMFGDVLISADSRIVPTAAQPLSGYEALADENHLILGHPRLHLKCLPRFKGQRSMIMCTSGSCTTKNYSQSKAGDKGYIHHSYGFTVVELREDGTSMPLRHVKALSNGSFCDLGLHVSGEEVTEVNRVSGYTLGDIHHRNMHLGKINASLNVIQKLNADKVVAHDIFDGSTVNPHEKKNMFIQKLKIKEGLSYVEDEVEECLAFGVNLKNLVNDLYIVQSNHDDFLDRYVNDHDWKKDLHNSEAYLKYATIQQEVDLRRHGNIFGYLAHKKGLKYIPTTESLQIEGYECGQHGDHGVNGSRGSMNSFKRFNKKMIIGHAHTPGLTDGVTQVGISCKMWQYYNSNGMSSWNFADAIVHKNGKSQLIIFDEFTLEVSHFLDLN